MNHEYYNIQRKH